MLARNLEIALWKHCISININSDIGHIGSLPHIGLNQGLNMLNKISHAFKA